MKKILVIVTTPFDTYGVGVVIRNYTNELLNKAEFYFVLCAGCDDVGLKYIQDNHIKTVDIKYTRLYHPLAYLNCLIREIRKGEFDVVHAHGNSGTLFLEMYAAKKAGVKVRIAHCHNNSCKFKILHYLLKPFLNKLQTHALACSEQAAKWLFTTKSTVLNNAIKTSNYIFSQSKRKQIRQEYKLDNNFTILNVGRLTLQKNQIFLLHLMQKLAKSNYNIKLLLVGDGDLHDEYRDYITQHNLSDYVILAGRQDDISVFYQTADLFVFPSVFEGLGLALIEAQASGLDCIASDRVPLEANVSGSVKYLSLDEQLWLNEIVISIKNYDYTVREKKSKEAVRLIKQNGYDINLNAQKLLDIYNYKTV